MDFYTDLLDNWNMAFDLNGDQFIMLPATSYGEC